MRLDGVFTDEEFFSDFAIAQAAGDQLKDLKLARRDSELLKFCLIQDKGFARGHANFDWNFNRNLFHDNPVLREPYPKPNPNRNEKERNQPAVNFDRTFNDEEAIFDHFQQHDK